MRQLLQFASLFDPYKVSWEALEATLLKLGWNINSREMISDGLSVDFTMTDSYCAFELVAREHVVSVDHPDASDAPAMPPIVLGADGLIVPPNKTAFPSAPAPWDNPTRGMVYDKATKARHELIRSKGWKLIAIPAPTWEHACSMPHQHYARRDYLLSLTLPLAPFESRPIALQAGPRAGSGAVKPKVEAGGDTALAIRARNTGTSNRSKRRTSMAIDTANESQRVKDKLMGASTRGVQRDRRHSLRGGAGLATSVTLADVPAGDEDHDGAGASSEEGAGKAKVKKAAPAAKPRRKESGGFRR